MANELIQLVLPHPLVLAAAVAFDLALGDPVYRWHPVRLIGRSLAGLERCLRRLGADGYGGGVALFLLLASTWVALICGVVIGAALIATALAWALHLFFLYSLLALGDLVRHVWRTERAAAAGDLAGARGAIAYLVGRDTATMDAAACRRAAIESLSENLTDGFVSPVFWYAAGGLPALVLFKVVSTMDSMIGYKTPLHVRFGWCGARLDDVMNFVPARLTWVLLVAVAAVVPRYSSGKAFLVGLRQHALLPGPNAGWSEAATAGALQRRLVGPIHVQGHLVTDTWLGDPADPAAGTRDDVVRAIVLVTAAGLIAAALAIAVLIVLTSPAP